MANDCAECERLRHEVVTSTFRFYKLRSQLEITRLQYDQESMNHLRRQLDHAIAERDEAKREYQSHKQQAHPSE